MKRGATLSPHGTAAERFGRQRGDDRDALGAFFRRIANGARGHDLGDGSLYLAEELVRLPWSLAPQERKALALIVLASIIGLRSGSTRLPLSDRADSYLGRIVTSIIKSATPAAADEDPRALLRMIARLPTMVTFDRLIGAPDDHRPLIFSDDCIYQQSMFFAEQRTIAALRRRLEAPATLAADLDAALADVVARPAYKGDAAMTLSDEQVTAVERALTAPLTVITGGPGTGKTAIVAALLRCLVRTGVAPADIALAAPTGKAVARISESLGVALASIREPAAADDDLAASPPEAQTIHRLLGYIPIRDLFRHHDNNPVDAQIVIVDEASMVDLALTERLLRALRPDTQLVLLGDADQLPSVDAGAVLRDLVAVGDAVRLTHSYRMDPSDPRGRAILGLANDINRGTIDALDAASDAVELIDTKSNLAAVEAFVDNWYETRVAGHPDFERLAGKVYRATAGDFDTDDRADMAALFACYDRSRLLCVTRRYATGAEAVNRMLHRRLRLGIEGVSQQAELCPGEPILMRRNDYERGLFNGDPGVVLRVSEDGAPQRYRAVFPRARGGEVDYLVFPLEALRTHVDIAFAITVHQSQGSEFDEVGLLLPSTDVPLLSREMLYTGITRARHKVSIVGSRPLLRIAANRTAERFSGIVSSLRK